MNLIFSLVKVSAVMLEKVRDCISELVESRFVTRVIPEALLASTPTERASCRPAAQDSLGQAHWGLVQNPART